MIKWTDWMEEPVSSNEEPRGLVLAGSGYQFYLKPYINQEQGGLNQTIPKSDLVQINCDGELEWSVIKDHYYDCPFLKQESFELWVTWVSPQVERENLCIGYIHGYRVIADELWEDMLETGGSFVMFDAISQTLSEIWMDLEHFIKHPVLFPSFSRTFLFSTQEPIWESQFYLASSLELRGSFDQALLKNLVLSELIQNYYWNVTEEGLQGIVYTNGFANWDDPFFDFEKMMTPYYQYERDDLMEYGFQLLKGIYHDYLFKSF